MKRIYFESHDMKERIHIYHHHTVRKSPAALPVGFNWHENIEILCIAEGSGHILCNATPYPVKKGDIFIVNAHELHGMTSANSMEYHCIIVNSEFLADNGISVTKVHFQNRIHDEALWAVYMEAVNEITSSNAYSQLGVRARILELFVLLMRNYLVDSATPDSESNTVISIKKGVQFMNAEYARKLSLDEIADAAGLSKYHFSREFKKATGSTVTSYLNIVRCNHAKLLLASKEYSVHDVAIQCGFTNDSLFSKTFRSVMGYSPSKVKSKQDAPQ